MGGLSRRSRSTVTNGLSGLGCSASTILYPIIILRSFLLGAATAFFCAAAAFPLAFFISGLKPRYKNVALTLVVIHFGQIS